MTKLMARAFCAFNALVFLVLAASQTLSACGLLDPALAAAGGASVALLCGLVDVTAAFFISHARTRSREVAEEAPALTPGQMLANQRWKRTA